MIVGIGLDMVEFDHFQKFYDTDDSEVLGRCFTAAELSDVRDAANPLHRLAARMAAKEAVLKVLGGLQQGTAWTDIEIGSVNGMPRLYLSGGALQRATDLEIRHWHLSLTHSGSAAAAVALAER
jgi:holo-[acyl-carrier protein] synthase